MYTVYIYKTDSDDHKTLALLIHIYALSLNEDNSCISVIDQYPYYS